MPDARFLDTLGPLILADIAKITGAELVQRADHQRSIETGAPLAKAGQRSITFISGRRHLSDLKASRAGACFVAPNLVEALPRDCAALITAYPQAAWAQAVNALYHPKRQDFSDALVHPNATIAASAMIAPGAMVGEGAEIGENTVVGPYAVISPGVAIGKDCRIGAHATVQFALIGDGVTILAGARVGEAGFGVAQSAAGPVDIPQLGRVIIQDKVTIGANSCVDRGAWEDTVIGEGCKLDNLVHVGHNSRLGRNCLLAAYTGISGSVEIGDNVVFGGRAGVADHVTIGAGASIAAAAGVMKDVPAGEVWGGSPARPVRRWMRETAWLAKMARRNISGGSEE